jgi:ATP adenylyltransferase
MRKRRILAAKIAGRLFPASADFRFQLPFKKYQIPVLSSIVCPNLFLALLRHRKRSGNLCVCMDFLFSPWRYAYVTSASKPGDCVFCAILQAHNDAQNLIIHRGQNCFVMLNAFPYTSGHSMVIPYEHLDELQKLAPPAAEEMMALTQKLEGALRELYRPDGINLGMNVGKAAGAGVAGHIHMHVLPRWFGDTNFMTAVSETRVLPEDLQITYQRLKSKF